MKRICSPIRDFSFGRRPLVVPYTASMGGAPDWLCFAWHAQSSMDANIPLPDWLVDDVVVIDLGPTLSTFCPADIDGDGVLISGDLIAISVSSAYGVLEPLLDFNADNLIDIVNLQITAQALGESCVPST